MEKIVPNKKEVWRLKGLDTFSNEWYDIEGEYPTEIQAVEAATRELEELEKTQPSESSGGQSGIQDRVFVVRPDGTKFRVALVPVSDPVSN